MGLDMKKCPYICCPCMDEAGDGPDRWIIAYRAVGHLYSTVTELLKYVFFTYFIKKNKFYMNII